VPDAGGRVEDDGRFLIPVTVDDLVANGLLDGECPPRCWERAPETLVARKDDIRGLAVATDERIEAYVLYASADLRPQPERTTEGRTGPHEREILALRSVADDSRVGGLERLVARLARSGAGGFRLPKVHPAEISGELLERLGFRADATHRLYAARARSGPA
jgi:hypothetical protein